MSGIAQVSHRTGMLMLPASNPYDMEVLFEEITWYARRDRRIRLQLTPHHWSISLSETDSDSACALCRRPVTRLAYENDACQTLCADCGWREVRGRSGARRP